MKLREENKQYVENLVKLFSINKLDYEYDDIHNGFEIYNNDDYFVAIGILENCGFVVENRLCEDNNETWIFANVFYKNSYFSSIGTV